MTHSLTISTIPPIWSMEQSLLKLYLLYLLSPRSNLEQLQGMMLFKEGEGGGSSGGFRGGSGGGTFNPFAPPPSFPPSGHCSHDGPACPPPSLSPPSYPTGHLGYSRFACWPPSGLPPTYTYIATPCYNPTDSHRSRNKRNQEHTEDSDHELDAAQREQAQEEIYGGKPTTDTWVSTSFTVPTHAATAAEPATASNTPKRTITSNSDDQETKDRALENPTTVPNSDDSEHHGLQ
ncbi:hypothetical protein D9756_006876 [Leucocoprinus leucothites]|uniref:Uncharacterized protein n=1 Tax=Leucocoprinus leucothites TaxID=201217 RepID=A0A8H5G259_9AGAR|nr:hypothetical protein D9756_006876 [Leucoagaricus leucothites]